MNGWFQIQTRDGGKVSARHLFQDGYRICQRWSKSAPAAEQDPEVPKCAMCLKVLRSPSRAGQYTDPDATPLPPVQKSTPAAPLKAQPKPLPLPPKPKPQPAVTEWKPDPKRIPTVAERVEAVRLEKLARAKARGQGLG